MSSLKRLFLFLSIVSALAIAFLGIFLRYRDDKMPCIFCDIAAKKSSTELVYEDEVDTSMLTAYLHLFYKINFFLEFCCLQ